MFHNQPRNNTLIFFFSRLNFSSFQLLIKGWISGDSDRDNGVGITGSSLTAPHSRTLKTGAKGCFHPLRRQRRVVNVVGVLDPWRNSTLKRRWYLYWKIDCSQIHDPPPSLSLPCSFLFFFPSSFFLCSSLLKNSFIFFSPLPTLHRYYVIESFDANNNVFSESKWNVEIVIRKHLHSVYDAVIKSLVENLSEFSWLEICISDFFPPVVWTVIRTRIFMLRKVQVAVFNS